MSPKRVVLRFLAETSDQPIIYRLAKDYDLMVNILKAVINPQNEGMMVVELNGQSDNYAKGLDYLRSLGVTIEPLSQDVQRNDMQCTQCGACTNFCPSSALYMERPAMEVKFDEDKCMLCLVCVKACPSHAMEVRF